MKIVLFLFWGSVLSRPCSSSEDEIDHAGSGSGEDIETGQEVVYSSYQISDITTGPMTSPTDQNLETENCDQEEAHDAGGRYWAGVVVISVCSIILAIIFRFLISHYHVKGPSQKKYIKVNDPEADNIDIPEQNPIRFPKDTMGLVPTHHWKNVISDRNISVLCD